MWQITLVTRSTHSWWKVIARRGSQVIHIDKLTEAEALSMSPAEVAAHWQRAA
jgi:hypothetical protein